MQTVIDRWNTPGMVFSNAGIAVNPFGDAIQDFDAGNCAMIRQASFAAAFLDDLPPIADGSAGAVDAFYNPGAAEGSKPLSTNFAFWDEGTLAVDGTKTVADVAAAIDAAWPN